MNPTKTDAKPTLFRQPSSRSAVAPFIVMDVISAAARREAEGKAVVHMEVGQPGTPAPSSARHAVTQRIDHETLGYTEALGIQPLRQRIARHYQEMYAVDVAPSRVIVTAGSSAAFVLAFLALFDTADTVLLPSPGYPCYRHILSALGVNSQLIETGPSDRWMPTPDAIIAAAVHGSVDGLLVASPSNPTGTMLEPERLKGLIDACQRHGLWFISDEIYHGLTYTLPAETALRYSNDAIVINSFSKYFSMTGWRIGWMVVPEGLVRTVERLAQNLYISPPTVSQVAALAAFDSLDELDANRAVYAANRDLLLRELPAAGFDDIVPADGAFYLYANVSRHVPRLFEDSAALARAMLDETGVAITPGIDFDEARGGQFVRFSYSGTTAAMTDGVRRLQRWRRLTG